MKNFVLWSGTVTQKMIAYACIVCGLVAGVVTADLYDSYSNIKVSDVSDLVPPKGAEDTELVAIPPKPVVPESTNDPRNILVMGSDEREEGSAITGMRSDTTMIVNISSDRTTITGTTIPRDSWVTVPSCKRSDGSTSAPHTGKFNYAFAAGGSRGDVTSAAACTITAVQSLTGVTIDDFVVINMDGFKEIVDTLGGVEMTLEQPINSPKANINLPAGTQTLNGKDALGYARARSGEGLDGSDTQRIVRQQELFTAIAQTAKNKITNPTTALNLIKKASEMVTISPELIPHKSYGLVWELRNAKVNLIPLPTKPRGDGANVVWTEEAYDLFEQFEGDGFVNPQVEHTKSSFERAKVQELYKSDTMTPR